MAKIDAFVIGNFSYHRTANGLGVKIWAKRSNFSIALLIIWLLVWAVGGPIAAKGIFADDIGNSVNVFLVIWVIGWIVGLLAVVFIILWQLYGYEMLFVTAGAFVIEFRLFLPFFKKIYEIDKIKHLRETEKLSYYEERNTPAFYRPKICFTYDSKVIKFALQLNDAEIRHLLELLKTDMPTVS